MQTERQTNREDNAFCNFANAPTPRKQVKSPGHEHVEKEDSVGGILVMT
jgi:hypothetical protein